MILYTRFYHYVQLHTFFLNSDEKRHKEAAAILIEYLNESGEEAVEVLTEGHCWCEAFRLAAKLNRIDLCETHLKPNIIDASELILTNIKTAKQKFATQVAI